ncbi:MAG TPA: hypothetical protein VGP72_12095 [Planctomycetota bacterium]|jgi:hypothetical protein
MTTRAITFDDAKVEALRAEAARRGVTPEQFAREAIEEKLPAADNPNKRDIVAEFKQLWASFPPGYVPPTDEEVERLLDERRMRKLR